MSKKWIILIAVLLAAVVVGGVGAVAFWEYHEQPQFCGTCHIMDPYVESWQSSALGANAHAEYDITCLDCHVPTLEQQISELAMYVTGDYQTPLNELKYPKESCYECHEHGTYEQIVEMTAELEETVGANPHASHYGELECRLCHKMHKQSEDYCAQCHTWGFEVP
ncbi:MAG: cytochrome c3 family protein [Anaerolineae bacterium]|nr:cytochrome c3 family protein [Anaerolineae bacterium]